MKKASKESIKIGKYIAEFLQTYLPVQKSSSEHTRRSYEIAISLYLTFLETVKLIDITCLSIECFRMTYVEEWLRWLKTERRCTNQTCNVRLAALRTLIKYLGRREPGYKWVYLEVTEVPRMKTIKRKVKGIPKEGIKELMAAPNCATKSGRKELTEIMVLYSTAARLDEILSATVSQFHLEEKKPYFSILGKGSKVRTIYLLPRVVDQIKNYLREFHGSDPDPNAYMFYSRNRGKYEQQSQSTIDKMLKKYARQVIEDGGNLPADLHAHQLRHSRATHWLDEGINIVQISFLLGHEQLETTMVYLDVSDQAKMEALSTLENEDEKTVKPKWTKKMETLKELCGLH